MTVGNPLRIFSSKLQRLKSDLSKWNTNCFKNIFKEVYKFEFEVIQLESIYETYPTSTNISNLAKTKADLLVALSKEETFWGQKMKGKWLLEGESNTKIFHSSVKTRRLHQMIHKVKDSDGCWLDKEADIK